MSTETRPTIGPYQTIRSLGAGGMGEVFLAYDPRLDREVAIKRIRSDAVDDPERRARFRREARVAARLNHPAIVQVHDLLTVGDVEHIVMEYVPGPSLRQTLKGRGPLPPNEGLAIARDLAEGLAYAHRHGVVHRDLKTENVLITPDGQAKITDFGIARRLFSDEAESTRDATLTRDGTLLGTYRTMSPEQVCGDPVDARTDLFSFGVLLYEAFTGQSPFLAETNQATMQRVLRHRPTPVHEIVFETPPALSALIDYLLEKDPLLRPRDAEEVIERLRALTGETATTNEGTTAVEPPVPTTEARAAKPHESTPPRIYWIEDEAPPARPDAVADSGGGGIASYLTASGGRWIVVVLVLAAIVAVAVFMLWPDKAVRYVAVMRPELESGSSDEGTELLAFAIRNALMRTLISLDTISPKTTAEVDEISGPPAEVARAVGADDVVVSKFACRAGNCLVDLNRVRGADGSVAWNGQAEVPLNEPLLAAKSIRVRLREAYPELSLRPGLSDELAVEAEDYEAFLEVKRLFDSGVGGSELPRLLERMEAIRQSSGEFTDAYLLEAQIFLRSYHRTQEPPMLDRALDLIAQAEALTPSDPEVLFSRADGEIRAGKLDEADATLNKLETVVPGHVKIIEMRARIGRDRGNAQEALALYRRAIDRRPAAGLLLDYAQLALRQGEVAQARGALERHLELLPGSLKGLRLLATMELSNGDLGRAVELFKQLIAQFSDPFDLSNLGLAYMLLGRYGQAADAFDQAVTAAPGHPSLILNLAEARRLQGRAAEAESLFRQVLSLLDAAAGSPQHLMTRALALAHLGEHREAITAIQQALREQPGDKDASYQAALVYALVGERVSALVQAQEAIRLGYTARWFGLPWFDDLRSELDLLEAG